MSLDHLRVDGAMIRKFGPDAALLHALVDWRQKRRRGREWRASFADILDDIGLTRRRTQVARDLLTEAGLLECHRGGQNSMTWTTDPGHFLRADVAVSEPDDQEELRPHIAGSRPDVAVSTSIGEDLEDNYPPSDSVADGGEVETMSPDPAADVIPLDGGLFAAPEPAAPTPEQSTNLCRQAWIVAYTEHHGPPDPTIKRRALGQIKAASKDRESPDDWRALWRACQTAGAAGRFSVADHLGPALPRRPEQTRNPFLRKLQEDAAAGSLDTYLTRTPRSIG